VIQISWLGEFWTDDGRARHLVFILNEDAEMNELKRPKDSLWMGLLAMVAFILWGLWVNWEYGLASRIQVAVTQGVVSLFSTVFSAELIVWLERRFRHFKTGTVITGAASWVVFYSMIWGAHALAGTPELLATMLPGMIIGVFFCFGYAYRVARFRSR
jgi:ABC-type antimicrobial peptide transport system permease subunit